MNPVQQEAFAVVVAAKDIFILVRFLCLVDDLVEPVATDFQICVLGAGALDKLNSTVIDESLGAWQRIETIQPFTFKPETQYVVPVIVAQMDTHQGRSLCINTTDDYAVFF